MKKIIQTKNQNRPLDFTVRMKTAIMPIVKGGWLFAAFFVFAMACKPTTLPNSSGNIDGVLLGIFHEGAQTDLGFVHENEKGVGKKFSSVMWYMDWSSSFPMADAQRVSKAGYMPHITWEPWFFDDKMRVTLPDVLAGKWDEYIGTWAKAAAKFGKPMFLRWGHEFNGDWYPWSMAKNGENGEIYIAAYKKIHDAFVKAGAKNVKWIWCPNAGSSPNKPWNAAIKGYPGDDYVDWVGIDGYNFSGTDSFKDIFARIYAKLAPQIDKPIIIGEFATGGSGAAKADWIKQMAADLKEFFPAVRSITWFDINKELDWRLMTDNESTQAAREAFASDYFLSDARLFGPVAFNYSQRRASYLTNIEALVPKNVVPVMNETAAVFVSETASLENIGSLLSTANPITLIAASGEKNLSGKIRFGWNANALFFTADIVDDMPINNDKMGIDIWNGDCVEICISLNANADPLREFFTDTDFQLGFSPGKTDPSIAPSVWGWASLMKSPEGAVARAAKTESGYQIEGKIPWQSLVPGFIATTGTKLGFDFAFDDADASGARESQTIWNGDASFYSNPSQWGLLTLE